MPPAPISSSHPPCEEFVANVTDPKTNLHQTMLVKEFKAIGRGSFGTVTQAYVTADSEKWYGPVAMKRIFINNDNDLLQRELELLRLLKHPNIIKLKYFFKNVSNVDGKKYLYLAMEYIPDTLRSEIERHSFSNTPLPLLHIKLYTFQIAKALLFLHSKNIAHRDIKPSNILIDPNTGTLKICDFGSAKRLNTNERSVCYICSRYYRAPELILGCTNYSAKIDIWALGCVLGEMFLGTPLFQGTEPILQFREFTKLLGPPTRKFIHQSNPEYNGPLFAKPLFIGPSFNQFVQIFGKAGKKDGVHLIFNLLTYDPTKRLLPKHILCHPFLNDLRNNNNKFIPRGSPIPKDFPIQIFEFTFDEKLVVGDLMSKIIPPPDSNKIGLDIPVVRKNSVIPTITTTSTNNTTTLLSEIAFSPAVTSPTMKEFLTSKTNNSVCNNLEKKILQTDKASIPHPFEKYSKTSLNKNVANSQLDNNLEIEKEEQQFDDDTDDDDLSDGKNNEMDKIENESVATEHNLDIIEISDNCSSNWTINSVSDDDSEFVSIGESPMKVDLDNLEREFRIVSNQSVKKDINSPVSIDDLTREFQSTTSQPITSNHMHLDVPNKKEKIEDNPIQKEVSIGDIHLELRGELLK